jgi:hypothetical protein
MYFIGSSLCSSIGGNQQHSLARRIVHPIVVAHGENRQQRQNIFISIHRAASRENGAPGLTIMAVRLSDAHRIGPVGVSYDAMSNRIGAKGKDAGQERICPKN